MFKLEAIMYILGSYLFYRSFSTLRGKFSIPSLILLLSMIFYVLFFPTATQVKTYEYYFVELYTHYWGEFVVIFFYVFLVLFVVEGRKVSAAMDNKIKRKVHQYMFIVIITITGAIIIRFLCLYYFLPHLDPLVFLIGYTVLYLFFQG